MTGMHMISCIRFSLQLLITESIYTFGLKRKKYFFWRILLGIVLYFGLALTTFYLLAGIPSENPFISIIYYSCMFVYSLITMNLCFDEKREELLFSGVCGYATQHISYAAVTIIVELTGIEFSVFWEFLLIRLLPYLIVSIVIYWTIVRRYEGKAEHKSRDIRMILLSLVILFIVVVNSVLVDSRMFRGESALLQNVFCKLYAIACCFLAIFMAYSMSRQNQILREKETMEQMIKNMGEKQKLSKETIDIINIKCHDLKYRISKIPKIEDGEEQKKYIEDVRNTLTIYDNIFQTGNEALDLVLTEKSLLCTEYNIKLSTMVDGKLLNFMNTTDVYALFGNLMDNAIESVIKEADEEKRIISVSIKIQNHGVHIHSENYCKDEIVFSDGLPETTKEDKNYHGFGVKSIRYIVERYHGTIFMRSEKERFLTDIIFYPEK